MNVDLTFTCLLDMKWSQDMSPSNTQYTAVELNMPNADVIGFIDLHTDRLIVSLLLNFLDFALISPN